MGVEEAFQINAAGFFQAPEYSELPVRVLEKEREKERDMCLL
jgi:hypothetical protein